MIMDHAQNLPFPPHSARMGGKEGEIMSAYIFCPKCSTQCAKGTESCPKCEADLSYPNLYDEYSEYFQSRSFREREGSCYDGIVETQVLDGNRYGRRLLIAQHMKWDRSMVSNKIHSRLFELGIRDPELFRLLRKLDNIEKVEKEMTEDRPSFF